MKQKTLIALILAFSIIFVSGIAGCDNQNLEDNKTLISNSTPVSYEEVIKNSDYSSEILKDHYLETPANLASLNEQRKFWNHECEGNGGEVIEFYSKPASIPGVVGGDWMKKSVVDCGEYYWIQEFYDWGPQYFGPFNKSIGSNTCDYQNYLVLKDDVPVMSMQNCPGFVLGTAISMNDLKEHPFISAQTLSSLEESNLMGILNQAKSFNDFVSLLTKQGYKVEARN